MVPDTPNPLDQLLPVKHPQHDFFICDVADAVLKDLMPKMEHPFYALSKKPDISIRRYEYGDKWLEVIPSAKGQATIYDKDILIYVVSQVIAKLNRGEAVSRRIRFSPHDFLIFVNRGTGGKDYDAFCEALERLMGTVIKTNISTVLDDDIPLGDEEDTGMFHLIESANVRRKDGSKGRILWAEIEISEWIFNGIRRKNVLTLHRDYFRLRKPIERRVYEIARKLCGNQDELTISLSKLLARTGARAELKRFRHTIRELVRYDHLPDYTLSYDEEKDSVTFRWIGEGKRTALPSSWKGSLEPNVYQDGREAAPGWDIHRLEREWREWLGKTGKTPRHPKASFLGFCRSRYVKHGSP